MKLRIARQALDMLRFECAARAPEEACGLLLGARGRVCEARPAANVAENKRHRFEIDPAELLRAHREARYGRLQIIGCYHSHPGSSAFPSVVDAARALDHEWIWLIAGIDGENAYRVTESGRIHGRFEACEMIVED